MAKFNVVDMNGQHVSEIELSDAVFGITPNEKAYQVPYVHHEASLSTYFFPSSTYYIYSS